MNTIIATNIYILIKILLCFVLIFITMPKLIGRKIYNIKLNFFKILTISIFTVITSTYILGILKLFSIFTFAILYFIILNIVFMWISESRIRYSGIRSLMFTSFINICDFIESRDKKDRIYNYFILLYLKAKYLVSRISLINVVLTVVFGYCFVVRLYEIVPRNIFYFADPYAHLMINKLFLLGNIFGEKFYPLGYHCVASILKYFSFSDMVDVYRFLGPIQSVLIIVTVYCLIVYITKNKYIGLFCVAIMGFDSYDFWPLVFYRQIVALPQEFSTIFFLIFIYFIVEYIKDRDKDILKYLLIATVNIFLIHIYVGILVVWPILGLVAVSLLCKWINFKDIFKLGRVGVIGGLISSIPFLIWYIVGFVLGLPNRTGEIAPDGGFFYRYLNFNLYNIPRFLVDALNINKDVVYWGEPFCANLIVYTFLLTTVYLLFSLVFKRDKLKDYIYILTFWSGQLFYIVFYYSFKYNGISIMYFERIGLVLTISSVVLIGLILNEIIKRIRRKDSINRLFVIIIVFMIYACKYDSTDKLTYQYQGAFEAYDKIKSECELLDWTIVSPVEELSMVYGYGYHYELWEFLQKFKIEYLGNKSFNIKKYIPSNNIFIYVEKEPLLVWFTLPDTIYKVSETERYYRMYQGRYVLEQQIKQWIYNYNKRYSGTKAEAKIYYEDNDLIVYRITP